MSIKSAIESFEGITLSEMDRVKLMNRTDRKFWFNISHLEELLLDIKDHYFALEIGGERNLPYATTYYDTPEDHMYRTHHRGKLNRFKIRRRNYVSTQHSFLEVKFKSNKGRTIKQRIPTSYPNPDFNPDEDLFIAKESPYHSTELHTVLENSFKRLMLVGCDMNERCTIDQELAFVSNGVEAHLEQLVIVEVKSEGYATSRIIDAMRRQRLKPSGFSKYCIGRSITDQSLRRNAFKAKHREIEKIIDAPIEKLLINL
ncbi:MAG: polyphosphate polymerase domain-containing protein [Rikenellaceae bacterium]